MASTDLTRREFGFLVGGMLVTAPAAPLEGGAQNRPSEPALDIADWSYHWYGVEHATLARGTVCNGMQMYVERWIPSQVRHPYPVVLIHGGYGQGTDWISTPDGRRGWASLLLEQGYKVYVVDRPGQGRNPYHPFVHGNFDAQAPTFERAAGQWPGHSVDDPAIAQLVASMGQPMANNANTQSVWRSRGSILLDDIGPAILMSHGDGVILAAVTAEARPNLVKGIVALDPQRLAKLPGVPAAIVAVNDPGIGGDLIRSSASMAMMEKNDREALQPVLDWMDR